MRHATYLSLCVALMGCTDQRRVAPDLAPVEPVVVTERVVLSPRTELLTLPFSASPDLDFGSPPLGTEISYSGLPTAAAREESCVLDGACGYVDAEGVDLSIGEESLYMKCIHLASATRPKLPFGLESEETPEAALERLRRRFEGVPFQMRTQRIEDPAESYDGIMVETDAMLTNELSVEYHFFLLYAPGPALRRVCSRTPSVFD